MCMCMCVRNPLALTGWSEQHITMDVANGCWETACVLDDADFYREVAYPVLRDASAWLLSRGRFTSRGFEVLAMGGPDESLGKVGNQAYFNVAGVQVLKAAVDCATMQGVLPVGYADKRKVALWKRALASFYIPTTTTNVTATATATAAPSTTESVVVVLPFDEAPTDLSEATLQNWSLGSLQYLWTHGIVETSSNSDPTSTYSSDASVAHHTISPALFNATYKAEEVLRARFAKANGGTGSGSVPCSNSTEYFICAVYGALAAHFGDRDSSRAILASFPQLFMLPPFYTTTETRSTYAPGGHRGWGHYMTNWGSHLAAVVFGLTGLRISSSNEPSDWLVATTALPRGWDSITIGRVYIKGEEYSLRAEHGKMAKLTKLEDSIEA